MFLNISEQLHDSKHFDLIMSLCLSNKRVEVDIIILSL